MDPVTQGTLGAALSQSIANPRRLRAFTLAGAVGGLAPDLDIFISSATDPLLYLEFHRQFSHSLIFIPFGAGICALVLYGFLRRRLQWWEIYLACLLGYATHGLLDACTSYGTQLFWPFSDARISWNWISVVDPLFSVPLMLLVVFAARYRRRVFAIVGLSWAVVYLVVGAVQHQRATETALQLAEERGHIPVRITVKPGFGNILLWKAIYEHDGRYHVDGIRAGFSPTVCEGERADRLELPRHLPWLAASSQQYADVQRFRRYSDDWLAMDREDPLYVVDVRYSALPNRIDALWGIKLNALASADTHAIYHVVSSRRSEMLGQLVGLLQGSGCRPVRAPDG